MIDLPPCMAYYSYLKQNIMRLEYFYILPISSKKNPVFHCEANAMKMEKSYGQLNHLSLQELCHQCLQSPRHSFQSLLENELFH